MIFSTNPPHALRLVDNLQKVRPIGLPAYWIGMLHSLSYPLNQIIVLNQTSPKPGEPVCHSAGPSWPALSDSSSTFSFEGTGVAIFSTVTLLHQSGRKAARGRGCRQQHPTRHGKKKKKQKLAFTADGTERVSGSPSWHKKKKQTGSDLGQDQIGSNLLSHFQEMALHCQKKTKVTKGERDLKASEK